MTSNVEMGRYRKTINADVDLTRCQYCVYDRWRIDVVGHQCTRKPVKTVDGVGFCKVHAIMVQP